MIAEYEHLVSRLDLYVYRCLVTAEQADVAVLFDDAEDDGDVLLLSRFVRVVG